MQPLKNPTVLLVSLRYAHGPTGDLYFVMGNSQGRWVLCGTATTAAARIHQADPHPTSAPSTAVTAKALAPAAPRGAPIVDNGPIQRRPGSALPRPVDTWARAWRTPVYGGVRVSVERLKTSTAAQAVGAAWLSPEFSDGTEIFSVPGNPRAVGLRYLGLARLWAQTESVGPYIDDVQLLHGPVLIDVEVGGLATTSDHSKVLALAHAVEQNARR
jgi:hypothetical protein